MFSFDENIRHSPLACQRKQSILYVCTVIHLIQLEHLGFNSDFLEKPLGSGAMWAVTLRENNNLKLRQQNIFHTSDFKKKAFFISPRSTQSVSLRSLQQTYQSTLKNVGVIHQSRRCEESLPSMNATGLTQSNLVCLRRRLMRLLRSEELLRKRQRASCYTGGYFRYLKRIVYELKIKKWTKEDEFRWQASLACWTSLVPVEIITCVSPTSSLMFSFRR